MGASFLSCALVFLGSSPVAGRLNFAAGALQMRMKIAQIAPGEVNRVPPRGNAIAPVHSVDQPLLLNPHSGVCFTMRTYKVKPTEEWQDSFNGGNQGYSTCRMGSDYRIRDAATPASK